MMVKLSQQQHYHYYFNYYSQKSPAFLSLFLLLFPIFSPSLLSPLGRASPSLFSEWNAPKPKHVHLLEGALQWKTPFRQQLELWSPWPHQGWKPCAKPEHTASLHEKSQGYIQVFLDGGLNQQRMGICDAVAVAKILNATLVIPHLEVNPVWQDTSSFADIFDADHFIISLSNEISVVSELPVEFSWSTREYYATGIRDTRIKTAPVHASADWYLENVLPVMQRYGIAAIAPFSHRLAFDNLPRSIQQLRCKVNFEALIFVPHIKALGESLVSRLRSSDDFGQGAGKYVVLHLCFDKTNWPRSKAKRPYLQQWITMSACTVISLSLLRQEICTMQCWGIEPTRI